MRRITSRTSAAVASRARKNFRGGEQRSERGRYMTQPSAFFLTPEQAGAGGGALRSACVLAYLRDRYRVEVAGFKLSHHSKSTVARAWRNGLRLIRGRPPLLDRYSGYEHQL